MKNTKYPCYECENRHIKCHSECELYLKHKEKIVEEWKKKRNFENRQHNDYFYKARARSAYLLSRSKGIAKGPKPM